jgi:hypothetical protein
VIEGQYSRKSAGVKHEAAVSRSAWIAPSRTDKDVVALLGDAGPRATALRPPSLLLARDAAASELPGLHSLASAGVTRSLLGSAVRHGRPCRLATGRQQARAAGESAVCRTAVKALRALLAHAQRPISKAQGGVSPPGGPRCRWPSSVAGKTTVPRVFAPTNSVGRGHECTVKCTIVGVIILLALGILAAPRPGLAQGSGKV